MHNKVIIKWIMEGLKRLEIILKLGDVNVVASLFKGLRYKMAAPMPLVRSAS